MIYSTEFEEMGVYMQWANNDLEKIKKMIDQINEQVKT